MDLKALLQAIIPSQEEIEQTTSSEDEMILLLNSTNPEGEAVYVYLSIKARQALDFVKVMQSGDVIDVRKYGKILKSGLGEMPPEEVVREMKEKYDADTPEQYLEKIAPEIQARMEKVMHKMAEDNIMNKIEEMKKSKEQGGSDEK